MITYPYNHYFSEDSVQTDIVITDGTASYSGTSLVVTGNTVLFTNENIDSESMSLLETLCSDNVLHWGRCEASELKFTIHSTVVPLEGTVLNVYLYFNNDASTLFKIGTYKVDSDIATAQRTVREITCYDSLLNVLNADYVDWYNALDFNTVNTVKKFRDAFFTHVGITQKTVSLVNDSATITKVSTEAISGSQILNAICEINGRFGHIDRNGQFAYIKLEQNIQGLYPAVDLYPSPTLYPQRPKSTPVGNGTYIPPLKYEKYEVSSITRLQIRTDDSDIGVVVGTAGTDYIIQGNFLTFNLDATALTGIANNILGEISGVIFQPFEVQMRANLCFEVGDAIRCNDDLTGVEGYILYRNAVGIQAMIDTFNCLKERDYKLDANSIGYQFNAVNNRTASIKTDINEVSATLTYQLDPTAGEPGGTHNSYAYQTAQEIGAKVETTTYNNFVNNTYSTFVTQTNSSLTAKAEKTVGNFTTGFSCTLDTTGHTWYKDNQQVMKIDGNGLTVTGTIKGSKFYCGTEGYETTLIDSEGKTARFANNTINFSDVTIDGTRVISADIAKGIFHVDYSPNDEEAGISIGGSSVELSEFEIINPVDLSIRRWETGKELTVLELWEYNVTGDTRVMLGTRNDRTEMPTQTYIGGKTLYLDANDNNNIYFNHSKTLKNILDDVDSAVSAATGAIKWGSSSGIETFSGTGGSGIAINPPTGTTEVHIGYSSSQLTLGSSSTAVRIKGHAVQFYALTIGPTQYYLLGYT